MRAASMYFSKMSYFLTKESGMKKSLLRAKLPELRNSIANVKLFAPLPNTHVHSQPMTNCLTNHVILREPDLLQTHSGAVLASTCNESFIASRPFIS